MIEKLTKIMSNEAHRHGTLINVASSSQRTDRVEATVEAPKA